MSRTKIEWAEHTWNPIVGCSRVSEGCRNCYAERISARLAANPKTPQYEGIAEFTPSGPRWGSKYPKHGGESGVTRAGGRLGVVRFVGSALDEPLRRKKPTRYFVCSMSDLFHEMVEDEWIAAVFGVMAACPQHEFMVLTKRPERMAEWTGGDWSPDADPTDDCISSAAHFLGDGSEESFDGWGADLWNRSGGASRPGWPLPNVWLGISVEDQGTANERIHYLMECPAAKRFISAEPLLGPIENLLKNACVNWFGGCFCGEHEQFVPDDRLPLNLVIVGGESGPGARPMHPDWARSIRDQCEAAGVAFHFKQWGEWGELSGSGAKDPTEVGHWSEDPGLRADLQPMFEAGKGGPWFFQGVTSARDEHMVRVGKKRAGRLLDGKEHNG